ncbi:sensor histidine kinase [Lucifera butyrica]|uniref:sensor histidine kinase n=1 Tax=Lucifera butyrica TaxID=1351585 RepID=UPI001A9CEC11|nr:sensor histidine kinase KdpD [Lucifera butyrica]
MSINEPQRRNPDLLLKKASKEGRGKLTIFLGAAAGVGKTFAMLENAHERQAEGMNVLIGWVETHGRRETEELVAGLPRLAPKLLEYRSKQLTEMDLDAIIAQHPELVLVDELAHTNVAGSCYVRRFQDVEEILNAGINVYTTLNIQHVESLNDIVEQITGIKVRETVPDSIIEQADQVQLIDIPPEDLIKRLKEGKVYVPGQVERALRNFFRPGNINALREMALRFTAHRVDQQLNEYMHDHAIEGPWPAAERIMVCVSASPFSAHLIRVARRLAQAMKAEWYAVHIATPRSTPLTEKERERLARNLHLAEDLGGKVRSLSGHDPAEELLTMAHAENITHIVIGKPQQNRVWEWLRGEALVDKLIRKSGGIHIHIVRGKKDQEYAPRVKTAVNPPQIFWSHYAGGLAMMGAVTFLSWFLHRELELVNIAMLYLLPVLVSATRWGRGPSYATAIATVVVFDFLFVPPRLSFTVSDIRYLWSFIIFLLVAFVAGGKAERLRHEARFAQRREKSTWSLYEFSREVAAQVDLDAVINGLAQRAYQALDWAVVVLLPNQYDKLEIKAFAGPDGSGRTVVSEPSECAVAMWAYEHGEVAGRATETLPAAQYLYLPLKVHGRVIGIFGMHMVEKKLTTEQWRLIDAWTSMAAIAVERIQLAQKASQAVLMTESERLRTALFNSISHEIRTPLATIIGSIDALLDRTIELPRTGQYELMANIKDGAIRMERVVNNLLDTARWESGAIQVKKDWCDIGDIVGASLHRLKDSLDGRKVRTDIPESIPMIKGDCVLLEQVLVNLVDNALKYSGENSIIDVSALKEEEKVIVSVADRGIGIPDKELSNIFQKFYRADNAKAKSGTGLGLSICKEIVEAHGGVIWAINRPNGGVRISFSLPVEADKKPADSK